jgi:CRISPR-associated protein Cas1
VEGSAQHARVDRVEHVLPEAEEPSDNHAGGDEPPEISRSVNLGSATLGISCKLDLVSTAGDEAMPVDTKRGKVPNNEEQSWEPERIQLMAQGLLLREHGYHCDHGMLYFAGSKTRVKIAFSDSLQQRTHEVIKQARQIMQQTVPPDPLENSRKCYGCSLNSICLPDETLTLKALDGQTEIPEVRRLYPKRNDALPFYVQEQGAYVGKSKRSLVVKLKGKEVCRVGLKDVSQLVLCGNIQLTAQALHLLCEASIPIIHLSSGNWFYGITFGITLKNSYNRVAQYETVADAPKALLFSREIVRAKGQNQRTLLRRNAQPRPEEALQGIAEQLKHIDKSIVPTQLLGYEGTMAAHYFRAFPCMFNDGQLRETWSFEGRNRRPPKDPINAMLSFGYALLTKECTVALMAEGLDPWWGVYHQPRHGRPGLALDIMEEFRALIVDSAVLTAVNTGMVRRADFVCTANGCAMQKAARKGLIQAYEYRLDGLVTHPVFDYRCSWRSIIRLQCTLLARWMRGDVATYKGFTTR